MTEFELQKKEILHKALFKAREESKAIMARAREESARLEKLRSEVRTETEALRIEAQGLLSQAKSIKEEAEAYSAMLKAEAEQEYRNYLGQARLAAEKEAEVIIAAAREECVEFLVPVDKGSSLQGKVRHEPRAVRTEGSAEPAGNCEVESNSVGGGVTERVDIVSVEKSERARVARDRYHMANTR